MSWINLALGLIREAATTEAGREIVNDIRSGSAAPPRPDAPVGEAWTKSVDQRLQVAERNTEVLVQMLNAQDVSLVRIQKRQRIWNLALSAAAVLALGLAVWAWLT